MYAEDLESLSELTEIPDDVNFYKSFWACQQFFSNPRSVYKFHDYLAAKKNIELILMKFNEIQAENDKALEREDRSSNKKRRNRDDKPIFSSNNDESYFFPKYLTDPSLFKLELANPFFRRQILVQIHILLQYFDLADLEKNNPFKLNSREHADLQELKRKVKKTLQNITPHGREFFNAFITMITHEKNWVFIKLNCF